MAGHRRGLTDLRSAGLQASSRWLVELSELHNPLGHTVLCCALTAAFLFWTDIFASPKGLLGQSEIAGNLVLIWVRPDPSLAAAN